MTPVYDGKLYSIDLRLMVWSVPVKVTGTVEVLDVRRKISSRPPGDEPITEETR